VSGNSRSRPFLRIAASHSCPKSREWNFHSHFRSRKSGREFSTPIPVTENWERNFHSRSRSQKLGMEFPFSFPFQKFGNGIFIPIPEIWECNFYSHSRNLGMEFLFPFPKIGNGICNSRFRSPKVIPTHPWSQPAGGKRVGRAEKAINPTPADTLTSSQLHLANP